MQRKKLQVDTDMKKYILAALAVATLAVVPMVASNDRVITLTELPRIAQDFVSKYFATKQLSVVTLDNEVVSKTYDLIYADGTKLEFDSKGNWTEVSMAHGTSIPTGIVPAAIVSDLAKRFPQQSVQHIERKRRGYELELSNGFDLVYDSKGRFVRIDD